MTTTSKSENPSRVFRDFFGYVGSFRWLIVAACALSVAGAALNLVGPGQLSQVTDLITAGLASSIDLHTIGQICALLVVLYGLGFVCSYVQGYMMATLAQRTTQRMRQDITAKINRLPLRYFDSHPSGDTLSRVTNDVDTVGQAMNQSLSTLVSSLSLLVGSAVMMFVTEWRIALSGVIATLLGFWAMTRLIGRSQRHFSAQQQELGRINGHIEEIYGGHTVVKAYNGEQAAGRQFHALNDALHGHAWRSQFLSGLMMPFMIFVGNFAFVVVCVLGASLAASGVISFGVVVAFMLYIRLFTQPLQNLSQAITSIQSMAAACERVFSFLAETEMPPETADPATLDNARGDIDFDHVRFGYTSDKVVIHDFSASARTGEKVAIVGPTGAGKTTIVNLLMRFYDVDSGRILINGVDTAVLRRADVRDLFAMVLQETWLFEGTMRENLAYNTDGVTDAQLDRACAATGLTDLVAQLPNGYDTILSDSVSLSAGQQQLITIARAMIKDAPLLILDEATSSVDTRTEALVQQAMDRLMAGRTSFVIAHRLSTIRNADLILMMRDGDIIESGTHDELVAAGGAYAELYQSQFEQAA